MTHKPPKVFALARRMAAYVRQDAAVIERDPPELSNDQLDAVQRTIDAGLEKGLTFTTVKRASW